MVDLSIAKCGDIVRVIENKDTRRHEEMAQFVGQIVTLREPSGHGGSWLIYEDEGTCPYRSHKYGGWYWYPIYLEYVIDGATESDIAPLDTDRLGALLFG